MTIHDATHTRLDSLEVAVKQMSDRVGTMAEFVQRLVVVEERNSFISEHVREIKVTFKESVDDLKAQNEKIEAKFSALNEKVVRLVSLCSFCSAIVAIIAPIIAKKFLGV